MANNGRFDPGTRAILAELRDMRIDMREDRRRSDDRFERMFQGFREDSARRDARIERTFKQIHTVGLAIVKTLNRHTRLLERIDNHHGRLLERIDRKLGAPRGNGPRPNGEHR